MTSHPRQGRARKIQNPFQLLTFLIKPERTYESWWLVAMATKERVVESHLGGDRCSRKLEKAEKSQGTYHRLSAAVEVSAR